MKKKYWLWFALIALMGCMAEDPEDQEPPVSVGRAIEAVRICADGPTIDGIDVYHGDGTVDWAAMRGDGIEFAFMKASQGDDFVDDAFVTNWAGARAAGIIRGAYHFFCANIDGTAQADNFLSVVGTLEAGDLPPVLDVEWDPAFICPPCCSDGVSCGDIITRVHQFIDRVESVTGRAPIIYTGTGFWGTNVCNSAEFSSYPLWVANWDATCPDVPSAWSDWVFWQTSDSGNVGGMSPVDLDVFNGDVAALMDFVGSGPVCGDGSCTGGETCVTCPADCGPCPPDEAADLAPDLAPDAPTEIPAESVEEPAADMNDGAEAGPDADARVDVQGEGGADLPSDPDAGTGLDSDTGCSCSMTT